LVFSSRQSVQGAEAMPHLTQAKDWLPSYADSSSLFDGLWQASIGMEDVTAVISGRKVHVKGDFMADIKIVTKTTCVMVLKHEDVRGRLSADGKSITWSDGDCWTREDFSRRRGGVSAVPEELVSAFDGRWEVMSAEGPVEIQIARKKILWHDQQQTPLKVLSSTTCAMIVNGESFDGLLSDDGLELQWSDGDVWDRLEGAAEAMPEAAEDAKAAAGAEAEPVPEDDIAEELRTWRLSTAEEAVPAAAAAEEICEAPGPSAADAAAALFNRDLAVLQRLLVDGLAVETEIESTELWRKMNLEPRWSGELPPTPLLVAAMLLQWPQGVELCVKSGANVNGTYFGPYRCADGSITSDKKGTHILRVALSARDHAQSLICGYILHGKVYMRTFNNVKKKGKPEMTPVTETLFANWNGPYVEEIPRENRG